MTKIERIQRIKEIVINEEAHVRVLDDIELLALLDTLKELKKPHSIQTIETPFKLQTETNIALWEFMTHDTTINKLTLNVQNFMPIVQMKKALQTNTTLKTLDCIHEKDFIMPIALKRDELIKTREIADLVTTVNTSIKHLSFKYEYAGNDQTINNLFNDDCEIYMTEALESLKSLVKTNKLSTLYLEALFLCKKETLEFLLATHESTELTKFKINGIFNSSSVVTIKKILADSVKESVDIDHYPTFDDANFILNAGANNVETLIAWIDLIPYFNKTLNFSAGIYYFFNNIFSAIDDTFILELINTIEERRIKITREDLTIILGEQLTSAQYDRIVAASFGNTVKAATDSNASLIARCSPIMSPAIAGPSTSEESASNLGPRAKGTSNDEGPTMKRQRS